VPTRRLTVSPGAAPQVTQPGALMVSVGCRDLRRRLGPMTWTVLEDLALDARPSAGGEFWARTSARLIAGHLGIEPSTAAAALRRLRRDGLVTLSREPGPGGRFGPSVYRIATIPGLTIAEQPGPGVDPPRMVTPQPARPVTVEPAVIEPAVLGSEALSPGAAEGSARGRRTKRVPSSEAPTLWDTPSLG